MTRLGDHLEAALTTTHEHDGTPLPAPILFTGVLDASPVVAATLVLSLALATPLWCAALDTRPPVLDAAERVVEVVVTRSGRTPEAPPR